MIGASKPAVPDGMPHVAAIVADNVTLRHGPVEGQMGKRDGAGGRLWVELGHGGRQLGLVFAEGQNQHVSAIPAVAADVVVERDEGLQARHLERLEGTGAVVAAVGEVMVPEDHVDVRHAAAQVGEEAVRGREHRRRLHRARRQHVAAHDHTAQARRLSRHRHNPFRRPSCAFEVVQSEVDVAEQ